MGGVDGSVMVLSWVLPVGVGVLVFGVGAGVFGVDAGVFGVDAIAGDAFTDVLSSSLMLVSRSEDTISSLSVKDAHTGQRDPFDSLAFSSCISFCSLVLTWFVLFSAVRSLLKLSLSLSAMPSSLLVSRIMIKAASSSVKCFVWSFAQLPLIISEISLISAGSMMLLGLKVRILCFTLYANQFKHPHLR